MRSFTLDSFDAPPALRDDVRPPEPEDGQVVVGVHASSVNPVDAAIAGGMLHGMFEYEFPVTLGRDFAGVVEQVGPGVTRFAAGDEVFGFLPHADPNIRDGSWTELAVVREDGFIASKPATVDFRSMGAAPLAAITALTAVDSLAIEGGDTLLVVGATGGVGSFAVQLAARAGAEVIAPALPEDAEFLHGLGVTELIERDADVAAALREHHPDGVDALLDLVSYAPDGFEAHAAALRQGGRGVSPLGAAGDAPGRFNVMGSSEPANTERVGRLLEDGSVRVAVQRSYGFDEAGAALDALGSSHTQGKLGISIAAPS